MSRCFATEALTGSCGLWSRLVLTKRSQAPWRQRVLEHKFVCTSELFIRLYFPFSKYESHLYGFLVFKKRVLRCVAGSWALLFLHWPITVNVVELKGVLRDRAPAVCTFLWVDASYTKLVASSARNAVELRLRYFLFEPSVVYFQTKRYLRPPWSTSPERLFYFSFRSHFFFLFYLRFSPFSSDDSTAQDSTCVWSLQQGAQYKKKVYYLH